MGTSRINKTRADFPSLVFRLSTEKITDTVNKENQIIVVDGMIPKTHPQLITAVASAIIPNFLLFESFILILVNN